MITPLRVSSEGGCQVNLSCPILTAAVIFSGGAVGSVNVKFTGDFVSYNTYFDMLLMINLIILFFNYIVALIQSS